MILTGQLIAFALVLQSLELFKIHEYPWSILQSEIPRPLRALIQPYHLWLYLRLFVAIAAAIFPHPALVFVLLLTSWCIAVRWRGTFNGGSDAMTFVILTAWLIARIWPALETAMLTYIAIQLVLSYFVPGVLKLRRREWRSGVILSEILGRPEHASDRALAWITMTFECASPVAMLSPTSALAFIALGCAFHFFNAYALGLNRFFFAWVSAYPALYWASHHYQSGV